MGTFRMESVASRGQTQTRILSMLSTVITSSTMVQHNLMMSSKCAKEACLRDIQMLRSSGIRLGMVMMRQ